MGPVVTRSGGYRRGVPKEEAALQVVESFFERELSVRLERITSREENYRQGDFLVNGSEATIGGGLHPAPSLAVEQRTLTRQRLDVVGFFGEPLGHPPHGRWLTRDDHVLEIAEV